MINGSNLALVARNWSVVKLKGLCPTKAEWIEIMSLQKKMNRQLYTHLCFIERFGSTSTKVEHYASRFNRLMEKNDLPWQLKLWRGTYVVSSIYV